METLHCQLDSIGNFLGFICEVFPESLSRRGMEERCVLELLPPCFLAVDVMSPDPPAWPLRLPNMVDCSLQAVIVTEKET